jgi:signal transduction histidine kinase
MLTENLGAPLLLVVEDDHNHAELIRRSFEDAPEVYRLEIANSLTMARSAIDRHLPALILTDYRLPDGEGSGLVETVKGLCPVILLTSQGNEQVAVDAIKSGVQDYVVKSTAVFSGMSGIARRSLREWSLVQEQKRAEEERRKMERHLQYVQKLESLGTMSGGIAHDFNNLLQAVLGNLELSLMKLSADAPVRNYICNAITAAERASKLSGMMLAYSGKGVYKIRELNLTELIEKNTPMLRAAISNSISFDLNLDPALPSIMADDEQIQQVLMNLIINASEAIGTVNGTISISTTVREFDQSLLDSSRLEEKLTAGRYVLTTIRDSGCGMDAATRDKLFDPFFTTKFTGRGLGLSAAQGIIRAHSGAIMVESSPGVGTTFQILFPIAAASFDTSPAKAPSDTSQPLDIRKPGTILIIDDEQIIRDVCQVMLEELGYNTLVAAKGEEGIRIFRELGDIIRLVILDLSMPGMDGVAVFEELNKIRPEIPVLLSSGYSKEELSDRFKGLSPNGFIQKPFKMTGLDSELRRVLMK